MSRVVRLALCALSACVHGYSSAEWSAWKSLHAKSYPTAAEESLRNQRWRESFAEVSAHNAKRSSWKAGLNHFSDLSWEEFRSTVLMHGQNCSATHERTLWKPPLDKLLPIRIDWRNVGALNAVKNQGKCGSCWTFSTTGSHEAHHFLRYGVMRNLSEQQLVDCAGAFDNHGCNGGLPSQAFEYLMSAGGHESEDAYPYTAATATTCSFASSRVEAKVASVVNITAYDESELMQAVGLVGPVSIAFDVSSDFRHYAGGVYDGECKASPSEVNHAVVAVGYDDEAPGLGAHWIIRNSWGVRWGIDGYFKMRKGVNKCGISDCASYPIVK